MDKTEKNFGRWLVYGAAAFQAYHLGRAFHVYDPDGWSFAHVNFGGLILGAILNVIIAQAAIKLPTMAATFSSLKSLLPKATKKADRKEELARSKAFKKLTFAKKQNTYSQVGFYILLSFSALMVAPALYILWTASLSFPDWFVLIMAVAGAVAPDVAITVGGFISGEDVQARSVASTKGTPESDAGATGSAKGAIRSPRKSDVAAAQMRACDLGCGMSYRWPQGKGAHMKKYHPELCIVKGTPAAVALPLNAKSNSEK